MRAEKLEEMCWAGQDVLEAQGEAAHLQQQQQVQGGRGQGNIGSEAGIQNSLSPEEEEYVRQYGDMLAAYKGQWMDIDLTGSMEPPRDLFVDVRVLKDAGEIQTEYGLVTLFCLVVLLLRLSPSPGSFPTSLMSCF